MSAVKKATVTAITARALPKAVDELGALLAQIAALEERADEIKRDLKATGLDVVEGKLFAATIIQAERKSLPKEAVVAALGQAWVDANSKAIKVTSVKVTSR